MASQKVDLTSHFDRFVEEQVASGRFKDAGEVVRAGLRLLELQTAEEREKLAALRAMARQAFDEIDSAQSIELNGNQELADYVARLGRRAAERAVTGGDDN